MPSSTTPRFNTRVATKVVRAVTSPLDKITAQIGMPIGERASPSG